MYVTASKAAKHFAVNTRTLIRWADSGNIDFKLTPGGQRRYSIGELKDSKRRICYCRVSSSKQRPDLERQIASMQDRFPDHEIVKDIASGINFSRPGLLSLLESAKKGDVDEVVVAHKDRLARFGIELVEWFLRSHGVRLVVLERDMEPRSPENELVDDLLSIVTVFACRRHGRRRYGKRSREIAGVETRQRTEAEEAQKDSETSETPKTSDS